MCGIAGYVNLDGSRADPILIGAMTDQLVHRGPDGNGVFVFENVALGHTRLAVIDLTVQAKQPMAMPDGNSILSYNGEVYNFRELRGELKSLGDQFVSSSDTEVVLKSIARWGIEAIQKFNGVFSLAILCRQTGRVFLARDRYGAKPLYYCKVKNALLFASEVKAFLAHPDFSAQMDTEGLQEYMMFQNFLGSRTLFKDVHLLPAGSFMAVSIKNASLAVQRYWDFSFEETIDPPNYNEAVEHLDDLFVKATKRQLVSDVPIGSYLSGGIDTGSITAVASQHLPKMNTFTVGFDKRSISGLELAYDERDRAEHMASLCNTQHYQIILNSGDMERAMDKLVWHLEEPRVGQSYPNFYAAQLAGTFNKVVLSGAGGDELFAGYPWRYLISDSESNVQQYTRRYYAFWQRLLPGVIFKEVLRPSLLHSEVDLYELFRSVFDREGSKLGQNENFINQSLYFEAKTFLQGLLVVEDKLSMAHGLESRVPFLDNDLVDFAMHLPVNYKLKDLKHIPRENENLPGAKTLRYQGSHQGKRILREVLSKYVPAKVTKAPKQGFSGPDASWFRGESIEYVRDTVLNRHAKLFDYLDYDATSLAVNEHLDGRQNRRLLIWSLLYLENWCRQFLASPTRG